MAARADKGKPHDGRTAHLHPSVAAVCLRCPYAACYHGEHGCAEYRQAVHALTGRMGKGMKGKRQTAG